MEEGMSWEMWKIALMNYAGRTSENGAFSQGNITTQLRFWGVRKGSPPVGPDVTLLASLTSGQILLGSFLQGRAEWTNPLPLFPPTGRYSMRPVLDGPGGRDEEARISAKTNCGSHPPLSWESRLTQNSLKAASVGSWIMTLLGFIPQVLVFWLRRQYLIHFSLPHVKVSDSKSQRHPPPLNYTWTRGQTKGIKKSIYVLSVSYFWAGSSTKAWGKQAWANQAPWLLPYLVEKPPTPHMATLLP